jgi:DNA mismatch endonuclease, patch repair protein
MADVHNPTTRSYNMSRIKGKDTKPEIIVRKYLFSNGFRYRLHDKKLPGKPDIILSKYNTVIFVHGCFWHGHEGCKYFVIPKTREEWWTGKIEKTKSNDQKKQEALSALGYEIITIWECQLKSANVRDTLQRLKDKLMNIF